MQSIQNIPAAKSDNLVASAPQSQQKPEGDFLSTLKEKIAYISAAKSITAKQVNAPVNAQTPVIEVPQQKETKDASSIPVAPQDSPKEVATEAPAIKEQRPEQKDPTLATAEPLLVAPQVPDAKTDKAPAPKSEKTLKSDAKKTSRDEDTKKSDTTGTAAPNAAAVESTPQQAMNANTPIIVSVKQPIEKQPDAPATSSKVAPKLVAIPSTSSKPSSPAVQVKPTQPHATEDANINTNEPAKFAEALAAHQPTESPATSPHTVGHIPNTQPHIAPAAHTPSAPPAVISATQALERSLAPSLPVTHLPSSPSQPQGIEISVPDNDLGQMHLRAVVDKDGKIHATVSTENSSTHEIVSNSVSHISTFLESERVRLDSLTISQTSPSAAFDTQQGSSRSFQQQSDGRQQSHHQRSDDTTVPFRATPSQAAHTAPIWHDSATSSGISLRA